MKIAPLTTKDPWFSHVVRHGKAVIETLEAVPVDVTMMMENVALFHGDQAHNFRPRLALSGQVMRVNPRGVQLPYGIVEMPFSSELGPRADMVYDFSTEQIVELVRKGYHESGFQAPADLVGIEWVLPLEANLVFVQPQDISEPPVVFVGLHNDKVIALNESTSGYEMAEYFENFTPSVTAGYQEVGHGETELALGHEGASLGDELDLEPGQAETQPDVNQSVQVSVETTTTDLYLERIAARLEEEGRLTEAVPEDQGSAFIPMSDDGYLVFELDDVALVDGSISFEFDDGEPQDGIEWGGDEMEYVLEPHQRASYIEAQKAAERDVDIASDAAGSQKKAPALVGTTSKAPRPHTSAETEPSESMDLDFN